MTSENNKQLFDKLVQAVHSYASSYTHCIAKKQNEDTYSDERGRALQALGKCVEIQTKFSQQTQQALKQVENSLQTIDPNSIGAALYHSHLAQAESNAQEEHTTDQS